MAFVAGFAAKSLESWLQDVRSRRREAEALAESRKDRWIELQRQTLLDLQEAGASLARSAGMAHHADSMAFRKVGTWAKELLPEEVDEGFRAAQARTTLLVVRIHDAAVREATTALKAACIGVVFAREEEASLSAVVDLTNAHEAFQDKIGLAFRGLDSHGIDLS